MNGILVQFKIFYVEMGCFAHITDIRLNFCYAIDSMRTMCAARSNISYRIIMQPIMYSHIQTRIIFDLCRSFYKTSHRKCDRKMWNFVRACSSKLIFNKKLWYRNGYKYGIYMCSLCSRFTSHIHKRKSYSSFRLRRLLSRLYRGKGNNDCNATKVWAM